jgi:alkanesulfonate monooxygenase SsuD/methylene tetrahydromethanopterin reductase-like flavin-dependent oxidoreductase (luciferase family)
LPFNSSVATYRPILSLHGFDAQADAIRAAWGRGDFAGMADAVTDEMLEAIAIAGTPEEARDQYARRRAGLFERTLLWTPFGGLDAVRGVIETFAPVTCNGV